MNAPSDDPQLCQRGVLLALDRDQAKQLFATRDNDALREFLLQSVADEPARRGGQVIDCEDQWQAVDDYLNRIATSGGPSEALSQCILGGRRLSHGSDMTVCLVRPDMVPHVAAAIGQVDIEQDVDAATAQVLVKIRQFYHEAAQARHAVVFAIQH